MRVTLLLCSIVGYAIATPTGTFHQEYSYKSSASSFKNNELQHRTDDQGYYKKDGDLEGRTRPRVDANSEHSEYVNPNLRGSQYGAYGDNTDTNSYGLMHATSGVSSYGANQLAEGIASSDRIVGSRGYSGSSTYGASNYGSGGYGGSNYDSSNYGSRGYGSSNYGTGTYGTGTYGTGTYGTGTYGSSGYSSNSYGSTASVQSIVQRLQQDFERDLQNYRWRDAYSQAAISQAELERQLRANLTERLNSELLNRYGQQTIRNGMSYSLIDGRTQSVANYDNQELANLKLQLENNLLNTLRNQYNQGYYGTSGGSSSRYESHSESRSNYGYTSSTVRPAYQTLYPSLPVYSTTQRSIYTTSSHSNYEVLNSNVQYTPVLNPESISTIASSVQTQLDGTLNRLLDDVYRKYFSSSTSYQLTNYDVLLNRYQDELRSNITYLIEESLRRNFGSQIQRDGYLYSIGPNGQLSTNYNYALKDLDTLKSQIERNLIEKLNREFNTYRTRYTSQSQSYSSQSAYVTTPRYYYTTYTTPRAIYSSGGVQDQYGYAGSSYGGGSSYSSGSSGYSSGSYSGTSMSQIQQQLQNELSRQLQAAISRDYTSHSSSGSYSPQNYQSSLQHLTDELNRNVTRHLQEYSASASYSASGNYDQAQIDSLRSQLLSSLTRQLQQNLQQHLQSSSSLNYRPVRGFQNYQQGQYRSGGSVTIAGEDCDHGETIGYRLKRSLYQPYRSNPLSYYQSRYHNHNHNDRYSGSYRFFGGSPQQPTNVETGQELDDFDVGQQEELGQEIEEVEFPSSLQPKPQKIQQEDDGQQVEDAFEELHIGQVAQAIDEGQQVVEEVFENLHIGQKNEVGQEVDDTELIQQVEVEHPQVSLNVEPISSQHDIGQEVDDSELVVGGSVYNQLGSHFQEQIPQAELRQDDVSHQVHRQVDPVRKELGQEGQQIEEFDDLLVGQQPESDLTGQVADDSGLPSHGNQVDNYGLTQQTEEFEPLLTGQQVDNTDLSPIHSVNMPLAQNQQTGNTGVYAQTEQVQDNVIGGIQSNLNSAIHGKPNEIGQVPDNSDLTQQTEEFEPLQTGQQIDNTDSLLIQPGNIYLTPNQQSGYNGLSNQGSGHYYNQQQFLSNQNPQLEYSRFNTANQFRPSYTQPATNQRAIPGLNGNIKPVGYDQELYNSDLSQQTEKFDALQTGQQLLHTNIPPIQPGNTHFTQPQQFPSISLQSVTDQTRLRPLTYWNSHQWKTNQERFISSTRKRLINKLEEALQNNRFSNYDREMVLKELSANLTKEISSYNENFLTKYMEFTNEEITGIKAIIYEDLRNHYDERILNLSHDLHDQNIGQTLISANSYPFQKPVTTSDSHILEQVPETDIQKIEQDDNQTPISSVPNVNRNNLGFTRPQSGLISNVENGFYKTRDVWSSSKWNDKQQRFIKQIESKLVNNLKETFEVNQNQNYGADQITKELSLKVQNAFANYNDHFLLNYLGFKKVDISEIQAIMLNNLQTQWHKNAQSLVNEDVSQTPGRNISPIHEDNYQSQQDIVIPTQNLAQEPETWTGDGSIVSHNQKPTEGIPQQNAEQFSDNSQLAENQYVAPLNYEPPQTFFNGISNTQRQIDQDYDSNSKVESTYGSGYKSGYGSNIGSGSGSNYGSGYGSRFVPSVSYEQPYVKPVNLPDSTSFINTELDYQQSNDQLGSATYYAPTPNKVENNLRFPLVQPPSVLPNQPSSQILNQFQPVDENQSEAVRPQQSGISVQSEGIGRVPLNKSTGQWFGLPRQDIEKLNDELIEKLKQKQTKPIVQVIEQDQLPRREENSGYGSIQPPGTTNNQVPKYNSGNPSSLFAQYGDDYYEKKLKYGSQGTEQQHFETTGLIKPIEVGQASVVVQREPVKPSNTYSGVKGYGIPSFPSNSELPVEAPGLVVSISSSTFEPDIGSEFHEETTTPTVSQENLPWWKRFGNSIKQGASNLKQKIVG